MRGVKGPLGSRGTCIRPDSIEKPSSCQTQTAISYGTAASMHQPPQPTKFNSVQPQAQNRMSSRTQQMFRALPPNYNPRSNVFRLPLSNIYYLLLMNAHPTQLTHIIEATTRSRNVITALDALTMTIVFQLMLIMKIL